MPTNVLIAGGGPAALEAALRLHRLAGDRVSTTVLAPNSDFTYRPLSVLEPFAAGGAWTYPLARVAADAGFAHERGTLARVDAASHVVETTDGAQIAYDVLLVASGGVPVRPYARATVFTGSAADAEAVHGLVQDVEGGYTRKIAFVAPPGGTWPLPLYELALMLAERAYELGIRVELHLVTPEEAPLGVFGLDAAREVEALLRDAGIALHTSAPVDSVDDGHIALVGEELEVQRVVTLPRLEGPSIDGLPADPSGFLVVDVHGRVTGVPDVYAAGDATAFAIKQGGLACQQADAAAAQIAAGAGADVDAEPFVPVLRGMLLTERWARFLRRDEAAGDEHADVAGHALWWPPTKIAGRELAGYLEGIDEELGRVRGRPVQASLGIDARSIEVLSLHS
ncbi:NAD(P)/FAD-dependent oxidoreductase [Candidatus Solirubrobacter pratensis]|uniref:NAD(P)/FAD-dependent oxidoreductase n=1 Tax=Candidatus Solirubrobacter pratensis TaxID=1298857 RepID=UPI00041B6503|nr:FAD-dependent oxidoreductase [Candidatus Solirubrobacter pratensis]